MTITMAQALFLGQHPKLNDFLDAIYFVVTSLTTTGYGDITIDTNLGRIFSVALMITGISLFFTIAQKVFAPQEKIQRCIQCGLDRHGLNARYCCNCGAELTAPLRGRARAASSTREASGAVRTSSAGNTSSMVRPHASRRRDGVA